MLKKKLTLLVMLVALFVVVATAQRAGACGGTCSGDNCGCGYYAEQCREDCTYGPPEYYFDCLAVCRKENIDCAKACCYCL